MHTHTGLRVGTAWSPIINKIIKKTYAFVLFEWQHLQLSNCKVHSCLSIGYLVRSMLQAMVAVMLRRKGGILIEPFQWEVHIHLSGAAVQPLVRSCKFRVSVYRRSVEHSAIAEDADQTVLHSYIMEERALRIRDERIGDPQQRNQPPIQTQTFHFQGIPGGNLAIVVLER